MVGWARSQWKLPALSGAILGSSYLSASLSWAVLVAFVPLLLRLDAIGGEDGASWRRAGIVFGATVNLVILHWMYSMLWVSWLGVPCYLGLATLFTAWTAACVVLLAWSRHATGWSFAVLLPAFWIPVEWLQAQGDLRMTAQHLAHVLACRPFLVQFADLVGPYGVGAAILAVNGLVYGLCRSGRRTRVLHGVGLVVLGGAILAYDTAAWMGEDAPQDGTLRVALVQPNVALVDKMDATTDARQIGTLARLTREAAASDPGVIVWPETARPLAVYHDRGRPETYAMPEVSALARRSNTAILAGVEYAVEGDSGHYDFYNAVIVVGSDGRLDPNWTAKTYLVPFVEGIPFARVLGPVLGRLGGGLRWLSGGFARGPAPHTVSVNGTPVGVVVCFEELYPDLARALKNGGARLNVVVTNHAWFRRSIFQRYAADAVRLRAIENRTAVVRCANTGISGFIDPKGRYHERTALFEEDVRVMDVPLSGRRTVYDRAGDLVVALAMAAGGFAVLVGRARERRAGLEASAPQEDPRCEPPSTS